MTAWAHLGGLESKRLTLFVGYCGFSSLMGIALAILHGAPLQRMSASVGLVIAAWFFTVSLACRMISRSERLATERYRDKINLLRRTMLELAASPALWAMQKVGETLALQVAAAPSKQLRLLDLLLPAQWNTALFMKAVYDSGSLLA